MKDYRKIVASNLSRLMSEQDKNQTDLMRDLNLSSATVSSWCTGKKMPRMDKVQILADYFQVEPSDIIEEKSYSLPDPASSPIPPAEMAHLEKYRALDAEDQDTVDGLTESLLSKSKYHTEEDSGQTGAA